MRFRATYRLQLTPEFGFAAAQAQIPYLRDLGISHLYLSPSLQARHGSTHGYDVIDPTAISGDLGGEASFRSLVGAAQAAGLGIVLDIVPNHMATDDDNRYWTDPELRERYFDIDAATGRHRRFFDIDDLAGVRQEDPEVFDETHRLVLGLVSDGLVDALRIDHPDGLADPLQYFERLREGGAQTVWIEKILESSEQLRDWPVTGTVGYEFLNDVCALFVDGQAEPAFTKLWLQVSGQSETFAEMALTAKVEQATTTFSPEMERLLAAQEVPGGADALARAAAGFPVYRSYVRPDKEEVAPADREVVAESGMPAEIAEMLLLERPADPAFVTRFQQTTPPVVAKGIEDTAFYRYGRLLALCDVGGDPGRFGIDVARFHEANAERAERFPRAMLTTMTHDTKRSSDVRARITALTWLPGEWEEHVRRWMELTEPLRSPEGAPDDLERYFLFQTLVGAWPIEVERVLGYMEKALREAKRNTKWIDQNEGWETGVADFCRALYSHEEFLADFEPFVRTVRRAGEQIALGTIALKLTAPGVPDIYQGDEMPLRALVDPDNRRPVDWEWHHAMHRRLQGGSPPDRETRKLWLTARLLSVRIRRPAAFTAPYEPLDAGEAVVAFRRGDELLVAVATRRDPPRGSLSGVGGQWRDVLYGDERSLEGEIPVSWLLDAHGVAVLERM
ncbi:MAG: malto-oligosyltrehalose synthase [Solirubrobacteraceae bacterium]